MIRVNLLPDATAPKGKSSKAAKAASGDQGSAVVTLLTLLILIGSLGGAGYWTFTTFSEIGRLNDEQSKLNAEIKKLEKEEKVRGKEYRALQEVYNKALQKGRVLLTLDPPDRIIWAEKLNMLAELRTDGIAITELELTEKVEKIDSPEYKEALRKYNEDKKYYDENRREDKTLKKPVKPKVQKIPILWQTLRITGIAYDPNTQKHIGDINRFREEMKSYYITTKSQAIRRFMDGFKPNIERDSIETIENYLGSDREVKQFTYKVTTLPMGQDDAEQVIKRLVNDLERRKAAAEAASAARGGGSN